MDVLILFVIFYFSKVLDIQYLNNNTTLPFQKKNDCQTKWDLFSASNCTILSKCQELIPTDRIILIREIFV